MTINSYLIVYLEYNAGHIFWQSRPKGFLFYCKFVWWCHGRISLTLTYFQLLFYQFDICVFWMLQKIKMHWPNKTVFHGIEWNIINLLYSYYGAHDLPISIQIDYLCCLSGRPIKRQYASKKYIIFTCVKIISGSIQFKLHQRENNFLMHEVLVLAM